MHDAPLVAFLRLASCALAGLVTGLLLSGPALAAPAVFSTSGLTSKDRLSLWSRLHYLTTSLTALLIPLLTASLALSALCAQPSDVPLPRHNGSLGLVEIVQSNRKSLFTVAAVLTLALRPYSFALLVPYQDTLKEEERRLAMRWSGSLSPVDSEAEDENPSSGTEKIARALEKRVDSASDSSPGPPCQGKREPDPVVASGDALISELTRLQLGTVVLAGSTFALTLIELICA
ncbi:hypothetical protein JCM21900_004185 [Sporobolomyces salmonicolor]